MNNINYIGKNCCGCRACETQCKCGAIRFIEDKEGFLYPHVDEKKCVFCGKCNHVCPIMKQPYMNYKQTGFALYLKEKEKLRESASGGAFTAFAEAILAIGGYVCGCAYDEELIPHHIIVGSYEELSKLKGSKYVQSNLEGVYSEILELLKSGKNVLFSGTPCQVAGLKNLVEDRYDGKLYCCDLICHGVPSGKLFEEYLAWLNKKEKGKILSYDFRSKRRNGWSLTYSATFRRKNGTVKTKENIASIDPYYDSFLQGMIYRESCYSCPYSCMDRAGDITIGDFWGVEKELLEMNNYDGVSAVLINSPKGQELFTMAQKEFCFKEVDIDILRRNNGNLNYPTRRPKSRNYIYQVLLENGFESVNKKNLKSKRYWIEKLRNVFPNSFRQRLKRFLRKLNLHR